MKRHVQFEGVRKWAGDDLLELQGEPLKVIDAFFAQYEPCIIKGCEVTQNGANYNVAPGMLSLAGLNHNNQPLQAVVPFAGATGVPLPLYLTLAHTVNNRPYMDGGVKPVSYTYFAQAAAVEPTAGTPYMILNNKTPRFVDRILPGWDQLARKNGNYPLLTAGDTPKLGGRPAEDYVLLEDLQPVGFKITDISGWTGDLVKTTGVGYIEGQVTRPWRNDALYMFVTLLTSNKPNFVDHNIFPIGINREFKIRGGDSDAQYPISCLDPQTVRYTTYVTVTSVIRRVYEILPKI